MMKVFIVIKSLFGIISDVPAIVERIEFKCIDSIYLIMIKNPQLRSTNLAYLSNQFANLRPLGIIC